MTSFLIGSRCISSSLKANNALCVCVFVVFFFYLFYALSLEISDHWIYMYMCVYTIYMQQCFMPREIDSWQTRLDLYSIYGTRVWVMGRDIWRWCFIIRAALRVAIFVWGCCFNTKYMHNPPKVSELQERNCSAPSVHPFPVNHCLFVQQVLESIPAVSKQNTALAHHRSRENVLSSSGVIYSV